MPWYQHIAAFLHGKLPQMRATSTNLALLTAAILNRRALALSELPGLPHSHHQRKKRTASCPIRALTPSTQCALMPAICQLAGLKSQTPIMIDW